MVTVHCLLWPTLGSPMLSFQHSLHESKLLDLLFFNAYAKSVLLYGSETWMMKVNIKRKLQSFINSCLRTILKMWWPNKISNEELWKKTSQVDINIEIRRRKFGWLGHTLRKNHDEICNGVLEWNPNQGSKLSVGRCIRTWIRSVLSESGKSISETRALASNHVRSRNFVDSLCSWWNLGINIIIIIIALSSLWICWNLWNESWKWKKKFSSHNKKHLNSWIRKKTTTVSNKFEPLNTKTKCYRFISFNCNLNSLFVFFCD